ncbi:ABC transporter substrate-binding protein, partial [Campylobacter jejuni]
YSMDERMLAATGTAGKGFYLSSLWSADLDNAQNKHFVDAFTKTYNRAPTAYAAQAYDTANLIASGLKAVNGD